MTSVAVVGAGIAGASTAFALARRGVDVTLIDNGAPGQATAASAGIIAPWTSSAEGAFYQVYAAGGAYYPQLLEQLAEVGVTRTDYRRTGSLSVHRNPEQLDAAETKLRARAAEAGAVAGDVQRLDDQETRELFPVLAPDTQGLLITGGGRVDGRTLRNALIKGATTLGAQQMNAHCTLQEGQLFADGSAVRADAVVIAGGAWTNALLEGAGVSLPVEPQRGQITHLRLEGVDTSAWPTVYPLAHHYAVAFDDGRIAVGATRENGSGFDARITAAGQMQVLEDALGIMPGLADATVLETRVGLRPLADELPVVGVLPEQDGVFVATGYGPAGLTMGPLLGDALARQILGESAPELEGLSPSTAADHHRLR